MLIRLTKKKVQSKQASPDVSLPPPANAATAPISEAAVLQPVISQFTTANKSLTTLADLRKFIVGDPLLSTTKRRDMCSSIDAVAKATGLPLSQLPCGVGELRTILLGFHPAQLRISKKRWANIKSDLASAQELAGLKLHPPGPSAHSAAWVTFKALTPVKHQAYGVSRLATYCSLLGIEPHDVTAETIRDYEAWLGTVLTGGDPKKAARSAAMNFNAILRRAKLERPLLNLKRAGRYLARKLETYLESYQDDIERYLERLKNPKLFGKNGPDRALKKTSLRNVRAHIRQLSDAAVTAGYPQEGFASLADLVRPEVLEAAAEAIRKRTNREFSGTLHNILTTARNIAVYYVKLPEDEIEIIAIAQARAAEGAGYNHPHLTEKNTLRLSRLDDWGTYCQLVQLPHNLMKGARNERGSARAALDAMAAVAMSVLLACPMRAKNLASLDITKHLLVAKNSKKPSYAIHVPKDEVKNRQDLDSIISEGGSQLIHEYLEHHHPVLAPEGTTALFPRASGQPRDPGKLGELVADRIKKHLGLDVNVHLFRHIAAKQYLEAFPGEYESVRRILGHAKIDTTTGYYSPLSNKAVQEKYHEAVLSPALAKKPGKGKK